MTDTEKVALSFPPAEPPAFPGSQSEGKGISRRKLAALAGLPLLGAAAAGAVYATQNGGDAQQAGVPATKAASQTGTGGLPTQSEPAPGLAPEISKIGSRHIAALHAIHNFLNHMSSYDPNSLDAYFAGAIDSTTGTYRQQLIDTQNATRQYFLATNSRSEVLEFNCGLRAITGGTALGIGYVKQSTASDLTAGAEISLTAAAVTAEEQPDGRWLISDIKRIST
ncbi:hypothetical protein [Nocardia yamanashiensis]|uniref:hypothetical protein n=1 Tax=Nocardia yamanashiensis TaxID=209247 RepID=UPI0008324D96|nr:hypothetical protein [Nocardia yamanashiensis]